MLITTVKSDLLAPALQKVLRVRQSNINPTLECVHCRAVKGGLVLTCTNLETTITVGIPADTSDKREFLIPYKLQSILTSLEDMDIEFHINDCLMVKFGDSLAKVPFEKPDEFPKTVVVEPRIVFRVADIKSFRRLLDVHKQFSSNNTSRPLLTNVCLTNENMSATDSRRLSFTDFTEKLSDSDFTVLLSKTFVQAFAGIEESFKVTMDDKYIMVNDKNTGIISRITAIAPDDENYPRAESLIPYENGLHVEVDRLELINNIKLALNLTDKSNKRVSLRFEKNSYELTAGEDVIEGIKLKGAAQFAKNKAGLKSFATGFDGAYLVQMLELLDGEYATFELSVPEKAAVFHEENNTFLIIPT